jgi:hypothetical protein
MTHSTAVNRDSKYAYGTLTMVRHEKAKAPMYRIVPPDL